MYKKFEKYKEEICARIKLKETKGYISRIYDIPLKTLNACLKDWSENEKLTEEHAVIEVYKERIYAVLDKATTGELCRKCVEVR